MKGVAVVALLLLTFPVLAQRYDDSITVNVVDVPVYVERFGVPITGLTRDDFELFVDGKPHPIEYFEVMDERREAASVQGSPADLRHRRLIVLLFDLGSAPSALQRSREAALKYVADSAPGDSIAVATVGRSNVRFLSAFTADRIAVQRAIGTLTPSASRDPFRVATLEAERTSWVDAIRGGAEAGSGKFGDVWGDNVAPGGIGMSTASGNAAAFDRIARRLEAINDEALLFDFVESLSTLADRLAPLEGVKQVVLLSDRREIEDGEGPVLQRSTGLHARFRAAGVTLNAVDIRIPTVPGSDAAPRLNSGASQSALPSELLYTLALDTGGAVTSSLSHLRERTRVTYVIGFRAPDGATRNAIHVNVKNVPRLTDVRYRKSYDLQAEKNGDKGLFLADTLLNDIPQNGVTLDLAVKGTEVVASIPGVELLSYASGKPLGLEVFFYVFNGEGRPFSWNVVQVAVDLEKGRDFLSAHPYTMRQDLVLQPGRYVVKALVRIAGTDRVGFERAELVVPPS